MIISASILQYNTFDIKRALDTKISELSDDGVYDFLPYPTIDVQSPYSLGPFWKGDTIVIKWNYNEPLNNLIPSSSVFLMSGSNEILLFENVPTEYKNINWTIPNWVKEQTTYFVKVESRFDGEIISDVSPTFTFDTRTIEITSVPPILPLTANQGEQYTITWTGKGLGDIFRIELINPEISASIEYEGRIGRIIRNPDETQQNEIVEDNIPYSEYIPSSNVIKVIEDKFYTTNGTYIWTVDGIENYDINTFRLRVVDSKYLTSAYSDEITINVPHISVAQIGRGIQLDLTGPSVITGSGTGDAEISAFGFNPSSFMVPSGSDFTFSYTSTNAVSVFLKKNSNVYYHEELSLTGTHTISNITKDEIYTLNAKDSNQQLKTIVLDIKLKVDEPTEEGDIREFSLQHLLMYSCALMQEVQTSGDAIIESNAPVNSKISFYCTEASQTNENTDERAVWYLLKSLNEDVLNVFIEGVDVSPKVILFDGTSLKNRVIKLNQEIGRRYSILITVPHKVSGYVVDSSNIAVPGVQMEFFGINVTTSTNMQGYYEANVPYSYSGSLIPSLDGYDFIPANISYYYTPITGDLVNPNFVAIQAQTIIKNFQLKVTDLQTSGIEVGSIYDAMGTLDLNINENGIVEKSISREKNTIYVDLEREGWTALNGIIMYINDTTRIPYVVTDIGTKKRYTFGDNNGNPTIPVNSMIKLFIQFGNTVI